MVGRLVKCVREDWNMRNVYRVPGLNRLVYVLPAVNMESHCALLVAISMFLVTLQKVLLLAVISVQCQQES